MTIPKRRFIREGRALPAELDEARWEIAALCRSKGLDFFETIFEMCTWEEINMLASYEGFPVRYPHWRWGMEYLRMQKSYEYGLHKIYEMVINTDPSYAYLLDNNLIVDQKLVMAHVYGHVDFFKNNAWFAQTNRKMLDNMANHATRVRRHMDRQGQAEVEKFMDLCLSMDNLVDPHSGHITHRADEPDPPPPDDESDGEVPRMPAKSYMDRHINPPEYMKEQRRKQVVESERRRNRSEGPQRDVLGFLLRNAPLKRWQRDVMSIVRDEARYFAPQGQTKIMNEGWATYWHTHIMTRHVLTDAEVVDYADHHSGTVQQQPGRLNPYKMGVELFRHIEERWDKGRFGMDWYDCQSIDERRRWDTGAGKGREKIFEVRKTHNDVTFLDTFLTEDFCREQGFFTTKYDPRARMWVIDSREFEAIKKQMLSSIASRGTPRVYVVEDNLGNRGEMRLEHLHDGLDVKLEWADLVLGNMARLWTRPVQLDTQVEGRPVLLRHDGAEMKVQAAEGEGGAGEGKQ